MSAWGPAATQDRIRARARQRWLTKLSLATGLQRAPQGSSLTWEESEEQPGVLMIACDVLVAGERLARLIHRVQMASEHRGRLYEARTAAFKNFTMALGMMARRRGVR